MEKQFLVLLFTHFVIHVSAAEGFVTHSRSFPGDNKSKWRIEYDSLLDYEFDNNGVKVFLQKTNDFLTNSKEPYNCTFDIDTRKYGHPNYHFVTRRVLEDDKFLLLTRAPELTLEVGTRFLLVLLDLRSCSIINKSAIIEGIPMLSHRSHDIYFENSTLCGDKYCKMTIDSQLNVVSGPAPGLINADNDLLAVIDLKYLTSTDSQTDGKKIVIQRNGHGGYAEKRFILTETGLKDLIHTGATSSLTTSFDHGIITVAHRNDSADGSPSRRAAVIEVHRFDLDGNLKLKTAMNFSKNIEVRAVKNLADGGFLLAIDQKYKPVAIVDVIKYDAKGHAISRPLEFEDFSPFSFSVINIYENGDGLNCLIQLKANHTVHTETLHEKCFRDDELKHL